MGTVGVVAQAGQALGPPGVISTHNASGGDGRIHTEVGGSTGCSFDAMDNTNISNPPPITVDVNISEFSAFNSCGSQMTQNIFAYARGSTGSTCTWSLGENSAGSGCGGCTVSIEGTASTAVDCSSLTGSGIGQYLKIVWGGGRGGQTYPVDSEDIILDVDCIINGVAATTVSMRWRFIT